MTKDEALTLALEALTNELACDRTNDADADAAAEQMYDAITAIKEALAQPERPWVGLTDEDFQAICINFRITHGGWVDMLVAQVEAKLKEKNT